MMLEWKPSHPGRWLFHCHFHQHISSDERIPVVSRFAPLLYDSTPASEPLAAHDQHDAMPGMNTMAGLVLTINVKPLTNAAPIHASRSEPHKIDLVIEPSASAEKLPTFTCSVREGKKVVASQEKSMGPTIVVTRGEPTEITVLNHLKTSTTIHWHGLELDSYYDGVVGGGVGNQLTPAIAAGASFVARFTPNRAGTFIYHTHAADPGQLTGGVYGALIVLEPGESFNPERDRILVLGSRDPGFFAKRLTLNGSEQPSPILLSRGVKYRLRVINMGPNLSANLQLGSKEQPSTWHAIAKDGATLPARLVQTSDAKLHIVSGETYDFEFQSDTAGEIPLEVKNNVGKATLAGKIVLQ
jgi:FtsP/CotA-like multicopper oxidase with cupredoxin domain